MIIADSIGNGSFDSGGVGNRLHVKVVNANIEELGDAIVQSQRMLESLRESLNNTNGPLENLQGSLSNSSHSALAFFRSLASNPLEQFRMALASLGETLFDLGGALQGAGNKLTLFVTLPLVKGLSEIVKLGTTATETEAHFTNALGSLANEAREFSRVLREVLGLNEFDIRSQIAELQVFATGIGLTERAAFDLSKQLFLLSVDLSSSFNLSQQDILEKLRVGIMGQAEPMRRLNVVIDENTVNQFAL